MENNIKLTKKHSGYYTLEDGTVIKKTRMHYHRDMEIAKVLAKMTVDEMIDMISDIYRVRNAISKLKITVEKDIIKMIKELESLSAPSNKIIGIIQKHLATSAGQVLSSSIAFEMVQEFVIEQMIRRKLSSYLGDTKARKIFSNYFRDEITIKDSRKE
jgi:hypothetical protein